MLDIVLNRGRRGRGPHPEVAAVGRFEPLEPRLLLTTLGAPGTPVFSVLYNLTGLPPSGGPSNSESPWTMSFDPTTQTIWSVFRGNDVAPAGKPTGGNRLVQFDPATQRLQVYNLQGLDPNSGPHGVFFDFETHLTPRVWFTERTGPQGGKLSYLDVARNELVTYDLRSLLQAHGLPNAVADLHIVIVDRRGTVWLSDNTDQLILELDFHHLPDGTPNPSINSDTGTLVIHPLPSGLLNPTQGKPPNLLGEDVVGPHGINVVVDDQTGQAYVWLTEIGPGRVALLRPAAGPGGTDLWATWDVSQALAKEHTTIGAPLFIGIDTAETPNRPGDDRIFFADPGLPTQQNMRNQDQVIRELNPDNFLADPNATSSAIETWRIPPMPAGPGSASGASTAEPNQVFLDREGHVFFIDRQAGVGRLDPLVSRTPDPFMTPDPEIQAPILKFQSPPSAPILVTPIRRFPVSPVPSVVLPAQARTGPANTENRSAVMGLNQYDLRAVPMGGQIAQGPFRGTLNDGNVLYGSLAKNDQLGAAVFAETARRPMTVVVGPGDARKAFQVLRDGSLVMTARGPGELIDQQVNLTRAINGPAITGDPSAVIDGAGVVHVFGRDFRGGLLEYRFDPGTQGWTARSLGLPPAGILAANPTAFSDPVRGAGAMATTDQGHLVVFEPDAGQVIDLTAQAQGTAMAQVYSSPGVVVQDGRIFAYGTNQLGDLLEYSFPSGGGPVLVRKVGLPGGPDTRVFQDVTAVASGPVRHVFATDGTGRLVHVEVRPDGDFAENITELAKDQAVGYAPYQQPFAGRVLSGLAAVVGPGGDLFVYGTNARDLVEFHRPPGPAGSWQITDLTNTLPANRVFGAPAAYILPNGDRHILQINEDAEVVEYYQLQGFRFSTQNITLADGHSGSPPQFPSTLDQLRPGSRSAVMPLNLDRAGLAPAAARLQNQHPGHSLRGHRPIPHPAAARVLGRLGGGRRLRGLAHNGRAIHGRRRKATG